MGNAPRFSLQATWRRISHALPLTHIMTAAEEPDSPPKKKRPPTSHARPAPAAQPAQGSLPAAPGGRLIDTGTVIQRVRGASCEADCNLHVVPGLKCSTSITRRVAL